MGNGMSFSVYKQQEYCYTKAYSPETNSRRLWKMVKQRQSAPINIYILMQLAVLFKELPPQQ